MCKGVTKERWEKVQLRIRRLAKQIGLVDDITPNEFGEWSERADKEGAAKLGTIHFTKQPNRVPGFWRMLR